jgi:ketosteroid isomerase-like protein
MITSILTIAPIHSPLIECVVMSEEDNKELIRTLMHHIGEGEIDRALELLSDDLKWKVVTTSRPAVLTKGQLRTLMIDMRSVFTDGKFQLSPGGMIASGENVVVESESYGRLKNGGIYNNKYHSLFSVHDGKVEEVREYMDTAHVIEVLVPALAASRAT